MVVSIRFYVVMSRGKGKVARWQPRQICGSAERSVQIDAPRWRNHVGHDFGKLGGVGSIVSVICGNPAKEL